MQHDAIIFDLGGVIINLDYNRTIRAFEALGMTNFREVYSQAAQSNLFDDFETGKLSEQRFINELLPYLRPGTTPNMVVKAWNSMILDVPSKKLDLLLSLRNNTKVYMLSNTNALHVPVVRREWAKVTDRPMEDFFDRIFFSNEIHLRKPNREVFNFVCKEVDLTPGRTLFIDDTLQHIEGARSAGIQAIHLTSPDALYQLFS